jgi:PTS system nitrogen regulatory IIA component
LFGRSEKGVEFESLDKKPVHFICLVIAPSNSTGQHLKALARISRLLKNPVLREAVLGATGMDKIYSVLVDEDSKFI